MLAGVLSAGFVFDGKTVDMMPVGTTSGTPQVLLSHRLKQLKLPTVLREYDKPACECARDGVDRSRYLEQELIGWERRVVERRITEARFPAVKSLDTFDFSAIPSLNKMLVLELARGQFIRRRENVIALGNSGTGETQSRSPLALPPTKVADNALHRGHCFDDSEAFTLRSFRFRGAGWHVESLDSNPLQAP